MKTSIQKAVDHCTTDLGYELTLDELTEVRGNWTSFCEAMLNEFDKEIDRLEEEEAEAQQERDEDRLTDSDTD